MTKVCNRCKQEKPLESFYLVKREGYRRGVCRDCYAIVARDKYRADPVLGSARAKRYRERHPEKSKATRRRVQLRWKFGITPEEYEAMSIAQGGVCAICERAPGKKRLAVDHNHATCKVRALLCDACNQTLGKMNDDPQLLRKAALYLELHGADTSSESRVPVQAARAPVTDMGSAA